MVPNPGTNTKRLWPFNSPPTSRNHDPQQEDCQLASLAYIVHVISDDGCKDTSQDDLRDKAAASKPSHSDKRESETEGLCHRLQPPEAPCHRHSSPARRSAATPAEMKGIPAPPPPVEAEERTQKEAANPATYSSDPALWDKIHEDLREYWIKMGPESSQNKVLMLLPQKDNINTKRGTFPKPCLQ